MASHASSPRGSVELPPQLVEGFGPSVSASEAAAFRREGYLVKHDFFASNEVVAMRKHLAALRNEGYVYDQSTTPEQGQHLYVGDLMSCSRLFRALAWKPEVRSAIELLIGGGAIVNTCQYFLKPSRTGLGTSWHQDNVYFNAGHPFNGVAMWMALDDCTRESGALLVAPESHSRGDLRHTAFEGERGRFTCKDEIDVAKVLPCCTKAGGVVFFCYGCAHASCDNISDTDRNGVAYHFLRAHQDTLNSKSVFGNAPNVNKHSPNPWMDDGSQLYGQKVEGTWLQEVHDALSRPALLQPMRHFLRAQDYRPDRDLDKANRVWASFARKYNAKL